MTEPLILLSNDDGVAASGLRALRRELVGLGRVVTVAPTTEQSAGSHALTLHRPLRHRVIEEDVHAIDGSPADCVYVALYRERFLPRWPDLVVSGINHGYNLGTDIYYSGTVAAAREAALRGIPSLALSSGPGGNFARGAEVARRIAERLMAVEKATRGGHGALLNVNFPGRDDYAGLRMTRLGRREYRDEVDVRADPRGREYFWIGGPSARHAPIAGSDTEAVDSGWVSVTPLILDVTGMARAALADELPRIDTRAGEER